MILHTPSRSRRLGIPGLSPADRLASALARRLDDGWHWFRSPEPGGLARIDAVLVGPGGTWALSFGGERGRFSHRNGHWYRWNRGTESWVPWDPTPITGARLAARRLALYLDRAALPSTVEPVLVGPHDMAVSWEKGESIGVLVEREPERLVAKVGAQEQLTQAQVDRIVALLDPRQPLPQLAPSTPRG